MGKKKTSTPKWGDKVPRCKNEVPDVHIDVSDKTYVRVQVTKEGKLFLNRKETKVNVKDLVVDVEDFVEVEYTESHPVSIEVNADNSVKVCGYETELCLYPEVLEFKDLVALARKADPDEADYLLEKLGLGHMSR